MLIYLNRYSQGRGAWLLLALSALTLELMALWFQHVLGLMPCVMCIYERCALFGVLGAGIVGAIAPRTHLRWLAILLWIFSACEGLRLSWQHTMLQLHPNPFSTCDFAPNFPGWLPLDRWFPAVFAGSGGCAERGWTLLNLSMPQWLIVTFAVYLVIALIVFIAQPLRSRNETSLPR